MNLIKYIVLILSLTAVKAWSQCPYTEAYQSKTQGITYWIEAQLDNSRKAAKCLQVIEWTNPSPDTIHQLQFYMYLNAFKNMKSTYLKDSGGQVFGNDISKRGADEWGWQEITSLRIADEDHISQMHYIQPDDENEDDETVLAVELLKPILPFDTIRIVMEYEAKLPKTIARAGYGLNDYYLFVHWFPQLGVFEQDLTGKWGWNCHQFMMQTEFYADFSDFNVSITLPDHLVIGASGCLVETESNAGLTTYKYDARDIIDFAWTAYPLFEVYNHKYKGTDITLLIPPEHCSMADRYLGALQYALDYFAEHLEPYPYPSITLVDPPLHTLNSGFMEYPMLITCASFAYVPDGIKTIESLAIHEFSHQYFMGIMASNEKEAPWLDEGFVTYFEDEIVDKYYGNQSNSLFDIMGYQSGNMEQSRAEYVTLDHTIAGPIARPGWEFDHGYKGIIYAKTATVLQTLKGLIGEVKMKELLRTYYLDNKFTHPREKDWVSAMKKVIGESIKGMPIDTFIHHCLHTNHTCDYYVEKVEDHSQTSVIHCKNKGRMFFPVEIAVHLSDGSMQWHKWKYGQDELILSIQGEVIRVDIDPIHSVKMDLNTLNNSWTSAINRKEELKVFSSSSSLFQHLFALLGALL